jgi:DNA invertase Pin-like site-specific DNA recombinase
MPKAFGYCRASTGSQSLTFDAQRSAIERYFQSKLEPDGVEWGGWFEDRAVSGKTPLTERPEGRKLWSAAQAGDSIIWSKIDRAFRSVKDGANVLSLLEKRGIKLHSLDIHLDTSTPMGSFVLHLLILLAQLEREWISSRTREAWSALKQRGYKHTAHTAIPAGWMRVGAAGTKRLVPDKKERAAIVKAYGRYVEGETLDGVANWLYFKGYRRHRGTMYKPEMLPYCFWCYRANWPKGFLRFAFDKSMREMLDGRAATRDLLMTWYDEQLGAIVEHLPQPVEAGHQPKLGSPGITPFLPAEGSGTLVPRCDQGADVFVKTSLELTTPNGDVE